MAFLIDDLLMIGGPILGGILGGIGQNEKNRAAQQAVDLQHKQNVAMWKFGWDQTKRQYKYDKESLKIQKQNIKANYKYQNQVARDNRKFLIEQRRYEYNTQMRAYEKSKETAEQQLDFNKVALDYALADTDMWFNEQQLELDFAEQSTMMEFRHNQVGVAFEQKKAEQQLQQTQAAGQLEQQKAYVAALKGKGQAVAKGGTESAARGAIAEAGLQSQAIIESLFSAEQTLGLSYQQLATTLDQLNEKFYLDKAQLSASRVSLGNRVEAMRRDANLSKQQADMNAMANMMLKPERTPKIPKVRKPPLPKLQAPLKPVKGPKPIKGVAQTTNPFLAGAAQALPGVMSGIAGTL